ncbi:MAG: cytochrome c [Thermodesulfobacteriota bacterium]
MQIRKTLSIITPTLLLVLTVVSQGAAADVKNGSRIYNQYCVACHGAEGKGDGDRAKNEQLDPRPRVHANGDYLNMIPDMRLFRVVKYGGRAMNFSHIMPQWQHILSDEEILDVLAHIRTLADPPYDPALVRGCRIPVPESERKGPLKQ